jgi:hypothetical protein
MGIPAKPVLLASLLAALFGAAASSAGWWLFWHEEEKNDTALVQSLERQRERLTKLRAELEARYSAAESARREAEAGLAEITGHLQELEEQNNRDRTHWEEQRALLESHNRALGEDLVRLEFEYDSVVANVTALQDELQRQALDHSLTQETVATEHDRLAREIQTLEESATALQREIETLRGQQADALREQEKLREALARAKQENDRLRAENQRLGARLAQSVTAPAEIKPAAVAGGENYRGVRLDSLRAAMAGRASTDRRQILTAVIPTIPDGITGEELAGLVNGMDGADVISVIESARPHIRFPVAKAALEQITTQLADPDARRIQELLK